MKWFSISGIINEVKKSHWPTGKELVKYFGTVLAFMLTFAVIFQLMNFVVIFVLKYLGI